MLSSVYSSLSRDQHWSQTVIRRMGVAWIHLLLPCAPLVHSVNALHAALQVFVVHAVAAGLEEGKNCASC